MRYTRSSSRPVERDNIPLLDGHIARLRNARDHFAKLLPEKWGTWPGDERVWDQIRVKLNAADEGDWRIRVLLHPNAELEVQVVPVPAGLCPFRFEPETSRPEQRRPLILDSATYDPASESTQQKLRRLYKTTDRRIYDEASSRGSEMYTEVSHPEVLLHTTNHLLESVTSNIAIHSPTSDGKGPQWVTPFLHGDDLPFLDGVMRRYLLSKGVVREGELTVDDWGNCKKEGGRVIGFNGLRGVWEAEPM